MIARSSCLAWLWLLAFSEDRAVMDCPMGGEAAVQASDLSLESDMIAPVAAEGISRLDNAEYWRHEVASRLERYRARRKPRAPRYPSLRLPFEQADSWLSSGASSRAASAAAAAPEFAPLSPTPQELPHLVASAAAVEEPELFTNVIEFPRYAAVPVYHPNELAEPIFQRPRILEAPEVLPPPPAMDGLLMEPMRSSRESERSVGADLAASTASLPRRMLAGFYDAAILMAALAGFGGLFLWVNPQRPPVPVVVTAVSVVAVILWATYEFLFTVYTGSTPGLRVAGLRLVKFDGAMPSRGRRRWRVLASYLSAFALGLGYLWSVLDEDGLCWHDRITRTHVS